MSNIPKHIEILHRGQLVQARKNLGCYDIDVKKGDKGVVFEPYDYYKDGGGPMVRWFNGMCCNVYKGDVALG